MNLDASILCRAENFRQRYLQLYDLLQYPEISADSNLYRKLSDEFTFISSIIERVDLYNKLTNEIRLAKLYSNSNDEINSLIIVDNNNKCQSLLQELTTLLTAKQNNNLSAQIEISSQSSDKTLLKAIISMYRNYAAANNLTEQMVTANNKTTVLIFDGINAYELLKYETGIHRNATCQVTVTVLPVLSEQKFTIDDKDIKIDIFYSSGAGGQNVNKVESAIRISHIETGIVVTCQDERSQIQNKNKALEKLSEKLKELSQKELNENLAQYKKQVNTDKLVKLRYYNFTDGTVRDLKTGIISKLKAVLAGEIAPFISAAHLKANGE